MRFSFFLLASFASAAVVSFARPMIPRNNIPTIRVTQPSGVQNPPAVHVPRQTFQAGKNIHLIVPADGRTTQETINKRQIYLLDCLGWWLVEWDSFMAFDWDSQVPDGSVKTGYINKWIATIPQEPECWLKDVVFAIDTKPEQCLKFPFVGQIAIPARGAAPIPGAKCRGRPHALVAPPPAAPSSPGPNGLVRCYISLSVFGDALKVRGYSPEMTRGKYTRKVYQDMIGGVPPPEMMQGIETT